ncbi:hypothetical protein K9L27_03910 [Candidatus Gracilibacteria bacterium]|nr:hypothetical protein [Candidatus Gracilibacteria bacterium]
MKKNILWVLGILFLWGTASAQVPPSASFALSVVNISQDNKNAVIQGAQPGDVLRYELMLTSQREDVIDFSTSVDVTNILKAAEIIDTGLGEINRNVLTYPAINQKAPCTYAFTFFARIRPNCGDMKNISVTWEGKTIQAPLHCGLVPTGPDTWGTLFFGFFAAVAIFISWAFSKKNEA